MQLLVTGLFASLPLTTIAGLPHIGSLHRPHYDHGKYQHPATHAGAFKLVDDYNDSTFFECVPPSLLIHYTIHEDISKYN